MNKAFDKVKHQLLIYDLFDVGMSTAVVDWFVTCLSKRKQRVVLKTGESSLYMPCESGVPQGSVLGPLLFSLYTTSIDMATKPARLQVLGDDAQLDPAGHSVNEISLTLSLALSTLLRISSKRVTF